MSMDIDLRVNGKKVATFEVRRKDTDEVNFHGDPVPKTIGHYEWTRYEPDGEDWVSTCSGELSHYVALGAERLTQLILDDYFEQKLAERMVIGDRLRTFGVGAGV